MACAALVLALFSVSQTQAQNPVPFKLIGTATWDKLLNAFDPNVGATFSDGAGEASHLGKFSASANLFGLAAPDPNGDFPVIGWVTLVAANGDQLDAFFAGILNVGGNGTADFQFIGGDGRFTGATGGGTLEAFFGLSGGFENVPMVVTWDGEIDY
jgi:hypothetical protein